MKLQESLRELSLDELTIFLNESQRQLFESRINLAGPDTVKTYQRTVEII